MYLRNSRLRLRTAGSCGCAGAAAGGPARPMRTSAVTRSPRPAAVARCPAPCLAPFPHSGPPRRPCPVRAAASFNHLVRAGEHGGGNLEPQLPGRLEIDGELEIRRLHEGELARRRAAKDPDHIIAD